MDYVSVSLQLVLAWTFTFTSCLEKSQRYGSQGITEIRSTSNNRGRSRDRVVSDESRLATFLEKRYRRSGRSARPVFNSSNTVPVHFALALIQILDFDETNQVLTTSVWKRYKWTDELLRWRPEDYGGLTMIRLPAHKLWTPDIVLYNNADVQEKFHQELIAANYKGGVRWIPPAIYKSACQIDMTNFPFDTQTCLFKFGSWTYDGNTLDLRFYEEMEEVDLREYVNSSEWDVIRTEARRHVRFYPCCGDEPFPDLTFSLTMKRRPAFYIYVLVLPSVVLSFLTLVLFWIPPQRPDRTSLGMSLFSSFFVLLLILVQSSPPTSASISLLGIYYCINMLMIAVSTMLSTVVINMTHYLQRKGVHPVIRKIFLEWLARILCAPSDSTPLADLTNFDERVFMWRDTSLDSDKQKSLRRRSVPSGVSEWRSVAAVIDRLFFLMYVTAIILALVVVFPR